MVLLALRYVQLWRQRRLNFDNDGVNGSATIVPADPAQIKFRDCASSDYRQISPASQNWFSLQLLQAASDLATITLSGQMDVQQHRSSSAFCQFERRPATFNEIA